MAPGHTGKKGHLASIAFLHCSCILTNVQVVRYVFFFLHRSPYTVPKINLDLRIKTKPVTVRAGATAYV